MGILSAYEPKEVFGFFEEICSMPHGSGNTKQISDYLVTFAKYRGLKYRQDEVGNVIIWKDGTPGYENAPSFILQGHMDMVAVKEADCTKNLETEGLDIEINGDYISAKGTSLGGDDGIAVAYALALLDSKDIPHPPLEVIITVDEEVGLIGATHLDCSDIKGRMMLNIDSEEEGIFIVSCAGGMSAIASLPIETEVKSGIVLTMQIKGFKGGHSGAEIHKGRLNSNIVLGRMLYSLKEPVQIVSVSGGEKENAISKISQVSLFVQDAKATQNALESKLEEIKKEYASVETGIHAKFSVETKEDIDVMDPISTKKVIVALLNSPNGIQRMNPDMEDMVQTSLNLGIVEMKEKNVVFSSALRSSSESEKEALLEKLQAFFEMLGGSITVHGSYPGWEYNPNSKLSDICVEAYREQSGKEASVIGIHAGLECGLFASKLPGLDAVSIGPEMHNIHTTDEVLGISSSARTWEFVKAVLSKVK